jgi:glycine cleavage system H protein
MKEVQMILPPELKYTDNDEWLRVDGAKGTTGITDYAQDQLSDIVFVEISVTVGDRVEKGDSIAAVESVKAAADVYMPVSGVITAVNEDLPAAPELVNSDPYGKAWMVEFEIADPAQVGDLIDSAAYQKHCEERSH